MCLGPDARGATRTVQYKGGEGVGRHSFKPNKLTDGLIERYHYENHIVCKTGATCSAYGTIRCMFCGAWQDFEAVYGRPATCDPHRYCAKCDYQEPCPCRDIRVFMKTCGWCGEEFIATMPFQRHCDRYCQEKAKRDGQG